MKLFKKRPRVVLDKYLMKQVRELAKRWDCSIEDAVYSIMWHGVFKINEDWKTEMLQRFNP